MTLGCFVSSANFDVRTNMYMTPKNIYENLENVSIYIIVLYTMFELFVYLNYSFHSFIRFIRFIYLFYSFIRVKVYLNTQIHNEYDKMIESCDVIIP